MAFEFVWDDPWRFFENFNISQLSVSNISQAATTDMFMFVPYLIWYLLKMLGGGTYDPFYFHLFNLGIHISNGLLLFCFLFRMTRHKGAALFGTLLFLVHPLQTEAVCYVSNLGGLTGTFFGLILVNLLVKNTKASYVVALAVFIPAILSKPIMAGLPLTVFVIFFVVLCSGFKKSLIKTLPFVIILVPVLITTNLNQPDVAIQVQSPLWARPLIFMDAVNFYLLKVINPLTLAATYARKPHTLILEWWFFIEWVIPVLFGTAALLLRKKQPWFLTALTMIVAGFLPVSGLVIFGFQEWSTVADRYFYFSMAGISLFLSCMVRHINKQAVWSIPVLVIGLLALRTSLVQVPVWKTNLSLWDHCIAITQSEGRAYNNRGKELIEMGRLNEALNDLNKAVTLRPENEFARLNRGAVFHMQGKYDEAVQDYTEAIKINPQLAKAYFNRGTTHYALNKNVEALNDYNTLLSMQPAHAKGYNNRGNVLRRLKQFQSAITDFTTAIQLDPNFTPPFYNRAMTYLGILDFQNAITDLSRYVIANPNHEDSYIKRGGALLRLKRPKEALDDFNHALEINPNNPETKKKIQQILEMLEPKKSN
ncbi:MAG: tetratricopeptide repeat protein [Deltaproteobacteria bacterium]|nr:tetratricopeptide repeat protein [Deltaproteobacteria bacterium]